MSWSRDLNTWTFAGHISAAENPCVIVDRNEYVLFDSPKGGIGVRRSPDLRNWREVALLTLGQQDWPWAQGRLTAGFVLDLRDLLAVGKAILFFMARATRRRIHAAASTILRVSALPGATIWSIGPGPWVNEEPRSSSS